MLSHEMLAEMPAAEHNPWGPFVEDAGRKLAAVSDRPDYEYRFFIVRSAEVNAFALPNGDILVTEGLLAAAGRDALAVAAVLGHEIGHVARRHSAETLQSKVGIEAVGVLLFGFDRTFARAASELGAQLLELGYGRDMELEADLCAARYLARLGYPPRAAVGFLRILASQEKGSPTILERYLRTHPPTAERLEHAEAYADSLIRK